MGTDYGSGGAAGSREGGEIAGEGNAFISFLLKTNCRMSEEMVK